PSGDIERLSALLRVARLVSAGVRGHELHVGVADTVARTFGFGVVLNMYRPETGDFEVTVVEGSPEARDALLGSVTTAEGWQHLLDPEFEIEGAYFVPAGAFDWREHGEPAFTPELDPVDHDDAWQPEDALFAALRH